MPPQRTPHPPAAEPSRKIFDPWNSSATGHQRADNRLAGSTSWRASRTMKLAHQYKAGAGGGKRMYDSVGAGSKNFGTDGRKENGSWEVDAPGLREKGWQDVRGLLLAGNEGTHKQRGADSLRSRITLGAAQPAGPEADLPQSMHLHQRLHRPDDRRLQTQAPAGGARRQP